MIYAIDIGDRTYRPIPASWLQIGTDATTENDDVRLYAVSATRDEDYLRIRYAHAKKPGVVEGFAPAVPSPTGEGSVPAGFRDGSWARSITTSRDARPTSIVRDQEATHLRRIWGTIAEEVPTDADVRRTIADGGTRRTVERITDLQQTHLSPIDFEEAYK